MYMSMCVLTGEYVMLRAYKYECVNTYTHENMAWILRNDVRKNQDQLQRVCDM